MAAPTPFTKGLAAPVEPLSGAGLRICIVKARWNAAIVDALVQGAVNELKAAGVEDVTIIDVSGSYELPMACSRLIAGSQVQAAAAEPTLLDLADPSKPAPRSSGSGQRGPFSAVIAVGVLIKGSTMHFEYICDAVSHGLMRVQLDSGTPVIFVRRARQLELTEQGVLTCLTEEQALSRAGQTPDGHNHGIDWGRAAVEQAVMCQRWSAGNI